MRLAVFKCDQKPPDGVHVKCRIFRYFYIKGKFDINPTRGTPTDRRMGEGVGEK